MFEIAANGDFQPFDPAEAAAQGSGVEQCLGGMFARSVAGVDHRAIHDGGDIGRSAAGAVADDQGVGAHRVQGAGSIGECFAFLDRAHFYLHRHNLRAEPVGSDFEAEQGAGGVFEKGVDDGEAVEPVGVAARLAVVVEPQIALGENDGDIVIAQAVDREKVHGGCC